MSKYDGLEDKKFNKLTIVKRTEGKRYFYDCICDCGKKVSVNQYNIVLGTTKSCGCAAVKDLTGKRFGKLVAIKPIGKKYNRTVWLCKCDCGNEVEVVGTALSSGNTNSCGCSTLKHGMFGTRIYNVWHTMKERCYVKSQTSYKNYGGRGIKVCDEWQEFIPFMKWAYENGYDENAKRGECTLDRIDVNGDYCPENCRWVSQSVQSNNRRDNVYIEYNGVVDTLSNHARSAGIKPVTAESRKINGDSIERIFRSKRQPKTISYKGKSYKLNDFCKEFGISRTPIENRVFKGNEKIEDVLEDVISHKKKKIIRNRGVLQYDMDMNLIREWKNLSEIQSELGFKKGTICHCCTGYSKSSFGYIWRYK